MTKKKSESCLAETDSVAGIDLTSQEAEASRHIDHATQKKINVPPDIEDIRPHFDSAFYLSSYPDVAKENADPLKHYWRVGWKEKRDPSSAFNTNFYLQNNADVRRSGINPFWHFVTDGQAAGRPGLPSTARTDQGMASEGRDLSGGIDDIRAHFDSVFYLSRYPDVARENVDPLKHYWRVGWKEKRDPSPAFNTDFYLQGNPDVQRSGVNPFWHFVTEGQAAGRPGLPHPTQEVQKILSESDGFSGRIQDIRSHFDSAFYLSRYPDVAKADVDPLQHFWHSGWKEGRDPNSVFSTSFYLDSSPDIVAAGINPFWHYVVAGQREGRAPRHPGGDRVKQLTSMIPLEDSVVAWRTQPVPAALLKKGLLKGRLLEVLSSQRTTLIVSVGHDHYRNTSGGVQLCIHREEALSPEAGCVYLNIHPYQPLPRLAHVSENPNPIMRLILDGSEIGLCRMSVLIKTVAELHDAAPVMHVVIHQMLGHLPERLTDLIMATPRKECWLWLHDFLTICPSYTLQRNNVAYCDAPQLTSNSCTLCVFGAERKTHLGRMAAFFKKVDVHVVSPSEVTLDTWQSKAGLTPASTRVLPHMTLDWVPRDVPEPVEEQPITVAFLGAPTPFKGWNVFERLVRDNLTSNRYRFVFFGVAKVPLGGVDPVMVHVTGENPDAMIDAVAKEKCDLVLHWASCPETFSLSTYEALAAGAYVLTNAGSGNVAATVRKTGRGVVLEDEAALTAFFEDGEAEVLVEVLREERRTQAVRHTLSRMTLELLSPVNRETSNR